MKTPRLPKRTKRDYQARDERRYLPWTFEQVELFANSARKKAGDLWALGPMIQQLYVDSETLHVVTSCDAPLHPDTMSALGWAIGWYAGLND